jgi:hypothetical protein
VAPPTTWALKKLQHNEKSLLTVLLKASVLINFFQKNEASFAANRVLPPTWIPTSLFPTNSKPAA